MGDRTDCTLTIFGHLKLADLPRLAAALSNGGGSCAYKNPAEFIALEGNEFEFYEVNYGEIDEALVKALDELGLSWSWRWGTGGSYGAGVRYHDAQSGDGEEFPTSEGEIVLTLSQIAEKKSTAAQYWHQWENNQSLTTEPDHAAYDALCDTANAVLDNWEKGDLAGAVNLLEGALVALGKREAGQ